MIDDREHSCVAQSVGGNWREGDGDVSLGSYLAEAANSASLSQDLSGYTYSDR